VGRAPAAGRAPTAPVRHRLRPTGHPAPTATKRQPRQAAGQDGRQQGSRSAPAADRTGRADPGEGVPIRNPGGLNRARDSAAAVTKSVENLTSPIPIPRHLKKTIRRGLHRARHCMQAITRHWWMVAPIRVFVLPGEGCKPGRPLKDHNLVLRDMDSS